MGILRSLLEVLGKDTLSGSFARAVTQEIGKMGVNTATEITKNIAEAMMMRDREKADWMVQQIRNRDEALLHKIYERYRADMSDEVRQSFEAALRDLDH